MKTNLFQVIFKLFQSFLAVDEGNACAFSQLAQQCLVHS